MKIEKFKTIYKYDQPYALKIVRTTSAKEIKCIYNYLKKWKDITFENILEKSNTIEESRIKIEKCIIKLNNSLNFLNNIKKTGRSDIFQREIKHKILAIENAINKTNQYYLLLELSKNK